VLTAESTLEWCKYSATKTKRKESLHSSTCWQSCVEWNIDIPGVSILVQWLEVRWTVCQVSVDFSCYIRYVWSLPSSWKFFKKVACWFIDVQLFGHVPNTASDVLCECILPASVSNVCVCMTWQWFFYAFENNIIGSFHWHTALHLFGQNNHSQTTVLMWCGLKLKLIKHFNR